MRARRSRFLPHPSHDEAEADTGALDTHFEPSEERMNTSPVPTVAVDRFRSAKAHLEVAEKALGSLTASAPGSDRYRGALNDFSSATGVAALDFEAARDSLRDGHRRLMDKAYPLRDPNTGRDELAYISSALRVGSAEAFTLKKIDASHNDFLARNWRSLLDMAIDDARTGAALA